MLDHPEIDQAFVYGDNKNYLVCFNCPNKELNPSKREIARSYRQNLMKSLTAIEKIKNFSILEEAFTAENNMLTPT